ncbi:MAG: helix-turn-helix domain-containing protein [Verrucomicrobiota bacterium]
MDDNDPLEQAREFIHAYIHSVDHFRVVLLLYDDPERCWQESEIVGRLRLPPPVVQKIVSELHAQGFVRTEPDHCFRYAPRREELATMMRRLAELDRERPVSLIRMIYSRPSEPQAFADAFRIRKSK